MGVTRKFLCGPGYHRLAASISIGFANAASDCEINLVVGYSGLSSDNPGFRAEAGVYFETKLAAPKKECK